MKSILYLFFFLILHKTYSFEYIRTINGKRNIVTTYEISKSEKFVNFTLDGTFTDNLGNYGIWDNASTVTLQNNDVINLQGYGKRIFQNNEIIYIKGFRNKQEQQSGVGKVEVINASSPLVSLTGMSCTYAVNFYEDNAYFIQKCKINEKQKEVLSNISKKKE